MFWRGGFVSIFYFTFEPRREKTGFCICENKDADQLRDDREADQRLCFRYKESTIPLLPKSEISSLKPSSVSVQPGLCLIWSETPKTGFLRMRLIFRWLQQIFQGLNFIISGVVVYTIGIKFIHLLTNIQLIHVCVSFVTCRNGSLLISTCSVSQNDRRGYK